MSWWPSGDDIAFYRPDDSWGEFSNFALYPILVADREWPTSEHYFQSCKFVERNRIDVIHGCATPWDAAQMGRRRDMPIRSDWQRRKDDVMRVALRAKFTQHRDLRDLIVSTGDRRLIEHTTNDSYWGNGGHGRGRNMLGVLLVELREELAQLS